MSRARTDRILEVQLPGSIQHRVSCRIVAVGVELTQREQSTRELVLRRWPAGDLVERLADGLRRQALQLLARLATVRPVQGAVCQHLVAVLAPQAALAVDTTAALRLV